MLSPNIFLFTPKTSYKLSASAPMILVTWPGIRNNNTQLSRLSTKSYIEKKNLNSHLPKISNMNISQTQTHNCSAKIVTKVYIEVDNRTKTKDAKRKSRRPREIGKCLREYRIHGYTTFSVQISELYREIDRSREREREREQPTNRQTKKCSLLKKERTNYKFHSCQKKIQITVPYQHYMADSSLFEGAYWGWLMVSVNLEG